jgi:hypothetical protein
MLKDDIQHCAERIAEEERLADQAGSWEAGLVHSQLAMLYKAQLDSLSRVVARYDAGPVHEPERTLQL